MTEKQFDVLDELYFVQSFKDLMQLTALKENELKSCLRELIIKGWVKCLDHSNMEAILDQPDMESNFQNYYYLATKAGLLAHNTT